MPTIPWKLDEHVAHLSLESLRATVDLRDAAAGLQDVRIGQHPLRANLLGVLLKPHVETDPSDAYVRCGDLVATYPEHAPRAMRVQVYWRCESDPSSAAIELQVSVQTDQLGIATPVVAYSQLEVLEVLRLVDSHDGSFAQLTPGDTAQDLVPQDGPGCLLFRLENGPWSYVEMIHAADLQADRILQRGPPSGARRASLEHRLFPGILEKGVILRARIRGLFIPREGDCAAAASDYQRFLESPLPLTT